MSKYSQCFSRNNKCLDLLITRGRGIVTSTVFKILMEALKSFKTFKKKLELRGEKGTVCEPLFLEGYEYSSFEARQLIYFNYICQLHI